MPLFTKEPIASKSLRALARLLGYPDSDLHGDLAAVQEVLHTERALALPRLGELDALIDSLQRAAPLEAEAEYVQIFDRGRATSLHLFEPVHGDSRGRGRAVWGPRVARGRWSAGRGGSGTPAASGGPRGRPAWRPR